MQPAFIRQVWPPSPTGPVECVRRQESLVRDLRRLLAKSDTTGLGGAAVERDRLVWSCRMRIAQRSRNTMRLYVELLRFSNILESRLGGLGGGLHDV